MIAKLLILLLRMLCGSYGSAQTKPLILFNSHLRKLLPRSLRIYSGSRTLAARRPDQIRLMLDCFDWIANVGAAPNHIFPHVLAPQKGKQP